MQLLKTEIANLLRLVSLTQDSEIDCEQCLLHVAEFAEQKLTDNTITTALAAVEQHLSVCSECREEFESLRRVIEGLNELSDEPSR